MNSSKTRPINYKKILTIYIRHVGLQEGYVFLGERHHPQLKQLGLTQEEIDELERIDDEDQ